MQPLTNLESIKDLDSNAVQVSGYFYVVDLGLDVHPRSHHVGKDKRCSCPVGLDCPAVPVVAAYLRTGGQRAPDPPHGYYPVAPVTCPVCGAPAYVDQKMSNKRRGAGWGCSKTGLSHYWQNRSRILAEALAANPWRFPPVVVREGQQINAWDGTLPGDTVLNPGLLRTEIGT